MMGADNPAPGHTLGEQLGHLEYLVTDAALAGFREAVQYGQAAYPNLAVREYRQVLAGRYDSVAAVSVAHRDRYYRPPVAGRRVQVSGWLRGRTQRGGVQLLTVETFAVDDIGTEILRSEHSFQLGAGRQAERLGRRPAASHQSGSEYLEPVEKRVTEEVIEQFEAAGRFLLTGQIGQSAPQTGGVILGAHAGAGLASGMGLAAAVAPGELGLAYLYEMLDRKFGIDFRQGGRLSVNYRRPIYAGDTLTARGLVSRREGDGERVRWLLWVWVENERGESVITGEAEVTVPSPLT